LLRALESSEMTLNRKRWTREAPMPYSTQGGFFVLAGAFEGLEADIRRLTKRTGIGFVTSPADRRSCHRIQDALVSYGMLRQLVGRATGFLALSTPCVEDLKAILTRQILPAYGDLLRDRGLILSFTEAAADCLADYAVESRTLSRGMKLVTAHLIEGLVWEEATGVEQIGRAQMEKAIDSLSVGTDDESAKGASA
jgi:ATP-dependent protease Clp ATPase subunit